MRCPSSSNPPSAFPSVRLAPEVHTAVRGYPEPPLDPWILHRLDVRCRGGVEMFREQLEDRTPRWSPTKTTPPARDSAATGG